MLNIFGALGINLLALASGSRRFCNAQHVYETASSICITFHAVSQRCVILQRYKSSSVAALLPLPLTLSSALLIFHVACVAETLPVDLTPSLPLISKQWPHACKSLQKALHKPACLQVWCQFMPHSGPLVKLISVQSN